MPVDPFNAKMGEMRGPLGREKAAGRAARKTGRACQYCDAKLTGAVTWRNEAVLAKRA